MNDDKNKIEVKITLDGMAWGFIAGILTAAYLMASMGV